MITSLSAEKLDDTAWRLTFASDLAEPVFYVYRNGEQILATTATSAIVSIEDGRSPVFDVVDDPSDAPDPTPDYVTLAWYASSGAGYYRVDQSLAAVWTEQARITDDGTGYFTWTSGRLADATTHQFRVVPVGANGNDGTPQAFTTLIVRTPDAPAVTYAYDASTGTATVS